MTGRTTVNTYEDINYTFRLPNTKSFRQFRQDINDANQRNHVAILHERVLRREAVRWRRLRAR